MELTLKILVLDIENSYLLTGNWGIWNQTMGIDQILDGGKVLCYAAKWLGEREIIFCSHDETHFLLLMHALLDEADAVITFNGKRHDLPLLNREFIKAGMGPPSPYKHIDLFETAKKHFKFPSNKLDYLLRELGLGKKVEHEGFPLWIKVLKDDEKAWKLMERYNIADVRLTEKLYNKFRGWIVNHPNHNLFNPNGFVCTNCGSRRLQRRGYYHTQTQTYQRYHCQKCGAWSRDRLTSIPADKRRSILTGTSNV